MNKLMLMGSAALLAMSGAAIAQSTAGEPAPDAAIPVAADTPAQVTEAAPASEPAPPATVAQSTASATEAAATTPAGPVTASGDATVATAESTSVADAAAVAPATSSPATTTANADVAAKVSADWGKYDTGSKGKLTALEFGNWILAKNGQDVSAQVEKTKTSKKANLPAIKVLNATASEFSKADSDKDKMISPDELTVYLSA